MTRTLHYCLAIAGVLLMGGAVQAHAGSAADVDIIVNPDNTIAISASDLETYFLMKGRHWPDGTTTIPLNLLPFTDARRAFDRVILGLEPDAVARYWLDQRIRSGEVAPRAIDNPSVTLKIVGRMKGAIGYVSKSVNTQGVRVIARIRDGKLLVP